MFKKPNKKIIKIMEYNINFLNFFMEKKVKKILKQTIKKAVLSPVKKIAEVTNIR